MEAIYSLDKFLEENKAFEGRFRTCKEYLYIGNNVKIGEEYGGICLKELIWKKDGTLELRRRKLRKRTLEIVEEIRPLWGLRIDDIYLKDIDEDIHIKLRRFQYRTLWKSAYIMAEVGDHKYIIVDNPYLGNIKKEKYIEKGNIYSSQGV